MILNKSFPEIVFRLKQIAWNKKDQLKYSGKPGIEPFFKGVPSARGVAFLGGQDSIQGMTPFYDDHFPQWKRATIEKADKVCNHHFDLLGHKDLSFGNHSVIDWQLDPVHDKRASLDWWKQVSYLDPESVGDAKIPWELNRHQHLICLVKADRLTGDPKYVTEYLNQMNSWIDSNPPKLGINWTSSLELSFRSIAWIWSLHLFGKDADFSADFLSRLHALLFLQAEHIEQNLSTYFSPNTHLTGEALGLFYVGTQFPETKEGQRWLEKGKHLLIKAIDTHVLSDGGYMERSTWYHRYTIDIYLHFFLLAKHNNIELPARISEKLLQLSEFLMYASTPDGGFPLIGDDDGGRLLPLDTLDGRDIRGLFSTLAVVFKRGDFKQIAGEYGEETFWLLGSGSVDEFKRVSAVEPSEVSKGFQETGFFFLRSDWSEKANYMAFDCGPHGWLNCGHAHADLLSFQINAGDQPVIVDSGTYAYVGPARDQFRGPDAHCTIKVDGRSPFETNGPFQWKAMPRHRLIDWQAGSPYDYVAGCMESELFWKQVREIFFIKPNLFFILDTIDFIADKMDGEEAHEIELRFPLFGTEWTIMDGKCLSKTGLPISIDPIGQGDFDLRLEPAWVSSTYGEKSASYHLISTGKFSLPCHFALLVNLSGRACKVDLAEDNRSSQFNIFSEETGDELFHYEQATPA